MSIDLDSTEGRRHYLSDKLDDLLESINDSYGTLLMEELLARLELTVKDFNDEMKSLCDELVKKEKERQQLLEMLKSADNIVKPTPSSTQAIVSNIESEISPSVATKESEEDLPEWEKKLMKLEKK